MPSPEAWVLSERSPNGRERIEGVALTYEAMVAWIRANNYFGYARTSIPCKIVARPAPKET